MSNLYSNAVIQAKKLSNNTRFLLSADKQEIPVNSTSEGKELLFSTQSIALIVAAPDQLIAEVRLKCFIVYLRENTTISLCENAHENSFLRRNHDAYVVRLGGNDTLFEAVNIGGLNLFH